MRHRVATYGMVLVSGCSAVSSSDPTVRLDSGRRIEQPSARPRTHSPAARASGRAIISSLVLRAQRLDITATGTGQPGFTLAGGDGRVLSLAELRAEHPDLYRAYRTGVAGAFLDARAEPAACRERGQGNGTLLDERPSRPLY